MVRPIVKLLTTTATALLCSVLMFLVSSGNALPANALPLPAAPVLGSIFHFSGTRPTNLGVDQGKLASCPSTPNCVSSQATDPTHQIQPLTDSNAEAVFQQLKAIVPTLPGAQVISENDRYLYAEFTSALMGFVDDVEFYLDQNSGTVQVRSASRLGESDLGVNRQRIENIRASLKQSPA